MKSITYPDFYNTENIMLERINKLVLKKAKSNTSYRNQIEAQLANLAETCQSEIVKEEFRYTIAQEYSDIVLAIMSEDGEIVVNKQKKK